MHELRLVFLVAPVNILLAFEKLLCTKWIKLKQWSQDRKSKQGCVNLKSTRDNISPMVYGNMAQSVHSV